jgi:type IV pilus assembly protein PilA
VRSRIVKGAATGDGFTLIEVILVLVIIGVLLAIAVPSILSYRNRASDAVAKANVRVAIPSIEAYHGDHTTYVGMTPAILRAQYDRELSDTISFGALAPTAFCVQSTVSGRTWRQNGPSAPIEPAAC